MKSMKSLGAAFLVLCLVVLTLDTIKRVHSLDASLVEPMHQLFRMWDVNGDGKVDMMEMSRFVLHFQENDEWERGYRLPDTLETKRWIMSGNGENRKSLEDAWKQMTRHLFLDPHHRESFTMDELLKALSMREQETALLLTPTKKDPCGDQQPTQLHIAPGQKNEDMTIMWTTKNKVFNPKGAFVQYGLHAEHLDSTVEGISVTYNVGETGWSGWLHRVHLVDLKPNTVYHYRVGTDHPLNGTNGENGCWSSVIPFRTLSDDPKQQRYPAKIAFFGDMGTFMPMGFAVTEALIYDHKQGGPFDLIHHIGDIAYAGTGKKWEFEFIWDAFMRQIQPLAQTVPYAVSVGNHEKYYNFTSYIRRFHTRGDLEPELGQQGGPARRPMEGTPLGDGSVRNFYYSFDAYGIHWVHTCTEQYAYPHGPGSAQYEWIEKDLQRAVANRHNVPWIVLMGHRSMYNSDYTSDYPNGAFQTNIEPLMLKYNVDFGLYGHWHMYERTMPMRNNVMVPEGVSADRRSYVNVKAPIHITVGNAGARIRKTVIDPQPEWSASRAVTFGYGKLTVHNSTSIYFEHVGANKFTVLDSFWVHKF